jgi:hypothetical protein
MSYGETMTDAAPPDGGTRSPIVRFLTNPITLWGAFVLVHLGLGLLALWGRGLPLGDVTLVYKYWVGNGISSGIWPGIDTAFVYPILALLPMIAAWAFGPELYASTWLTLVMAINAAAFAVLLHRGRAVAAIAWWWLAFLAVLGPIAVGRIDSVTVPIALMGMLFLATRPRLAAFLLTVAAWMKVWPAALVAAAIVTLRSRLTILTTAVVTSGVIVVTALILGSQGNVLSFITEQTGRGVQVESPIGTFWMWDAFRHRFGGSSLYYDTAILTYQLRGPGIEVAAAVTTPLLALAVAALLAVAVLAIRRGVAAAAILSPLALALTTALILFNKVGSPQFVAWLAVPIVFGLVMARFAGGPSFLVPAVLGLAIAGLTQLFYPYQYWELLSLHIDMLIVLTLRNLLYVPLFVWGVWALIHAIRHPARDRDLEYV